MTEAIIIEMQELIKSDERGNLVRQLLSVSGGGNAEMRSPQILNAPEVLPYAEQAAEKLGKTLFSEKPKALSVVSTECFLYGSENPADKRPRSSKEGKLYWLKVCLASHCSGVWTDWIIETEHGGQILMRPGTAIFFNDEFTYKRSPVPQDWHFECVIAFKEEEALEEEALEEEPPEQRTFSWALSSTSTAFISQKRGVLSATQCEEIISSCLQEDRASLPQDAAVGNGNGSVNHNVRTSTTQFLYSSNEKNHWLFELLCGEVLETNESFFCFDLCNIQSLQFTTYCGDGGFYGKHVDGSSSDPKTLEHRKLSFSVQLSPPQSYEGGDLLIHDSPDPKRIERDQGAITFFPSYALHEVTPVTKGTRHSLVGWVTGPAFK